MGLPETERESLAAGRVLVQQVAEVRGGSVRCRKCQVIVGTGQYGNVKLSDEADDYLKGKQCAVRLMPTPEAVNAWNGAEGRTIGMFHVTC